MPSNAALHNRANSDQEKLNIPSPHFCCSRDADGVILVVFGPLPFQFGKENGGQQMSAATRSGFLFEPGQQSSVDLTTKLDKLFIAEVDGVLVISAICIIAAFFEIEVTSMVTNELGDKGEKELPQLVFRGMSDLIRTQEF